MFSRSRSSTVVRLAAVSLVAAVACGTAGSAPAATIVWEIPLAVGKGADVMTPGSLLRGHMGADPCASRPPIADVTIVSPVFPHYSSDTVTFTPSPGLLDGLNSPRIALAPYSGLSGDSRSLLFAAGVASSPASMFTMGSLTIDQQDRVRPWLDSEAAVTPADGPTAPHPRATAGIR